MHAEQLHSQAQQLGKDSSLASPDCPPVLLIGLSCCTLQPLLAVVYNVATSWQGPTVAGSYSYRVLCAVLCCHKAC